MDWTWAQLPIAGTALTAFAFAFSTWLKQRAPMKQAALQGEGPLWSRIIALEVKLDTERTDCDRRIDAMNDTVIELQNQVQVLRHDRNNLRQSFNAMVAMLKQEGADIPTVVATVEDMLARGDQIIATEKGAMRRMNG